jgi:predicted SAM-dependent methyltransferase
MKLLNIGCGENFHNHWINIDIAPVNSIVVKHNIVNSIPFPDNSVDVIYHAHLLEHLQKKDGENFVTECHRVLIPGGIIRIVVPNLEEIVSNYTEFLRDALKGDKLAEANYDFTMIEMLDQLVRTYSGGELGRIYRKGEAINSDFIFKRMGVKLKNINIDNNIINNNHLKEVNKKDISQYLKSKIRNFKIKTLFLKMILRNEYKFYESGKFRMNGEVHQWMFDRFSLTRLLENSGYKNIKVCTAFESRITNWNSYFLDVTKEGNIRKPDSLFIEANK